MRDYEIRVAGHLGARWSKWFDDLLIINHPDGYAIICCEKFDQAALFGILNKIANLGLVLLSVNQITVDGTVSIVATPQN